MLIGGILNLEELLVRLERMIYFLFKRVDAILFICVAILLWASLLP